MPEIVTKRSNAEQDSRDRTFTNQCDVILCPEVQCCQANEKSSKTFNYIFLISDAARLELSGSEHMLVMTETQDLELDDITLRSEIRNKIIDIISNIHSLF